MNPQVVPPVEIVDAFEKQAANLFVRRDQFDQESNTLTAQREALLPKLVSGELAVLSGHEVLKR